MREENYDGELVDDDDGEDDDDDGVWWIDMRGDHSGRRGGKGKGTPGAWKAEGEGGNKMIISGKWK